MALSLPTTWYDRVFATKAESLADYDGPIRGPSGQDIIKARVERHTVAGEGQVFLVFRPRVKYAILLQAKPSTVEPCVNCSGENLKLLCRLNVAIEYLGLLLSHRNAPDDLAYP